MVGPTAVITHSRDRELKPSLVARFNRTTSTTRARLLLLLKVRVLLLSCTTCAIVWACLLLRMTLCHIMATTSMKYCLIDVVIYITNI
jgi:hypothetical protein